MRKTLHWTDMFDPVHFAEWLRGAWLKGTHLDLPTGPDRPTSRAQGYAIQREWIARLGPVAGWKIAATSAAGQKHIAVSGPLVGPIFANRVGSASAQVSLAGNRMRVAECELVFRFVQDLPARETPYDTDNVLAAVDGIGPGLEIPDSRFIDFEHAGEAPLIADCACCRDMVLGDFTSVRPGDPRLRQLAPLRVQARVFGGVGAGAGERAFEGVGSNVLGDPLQALVWMVNELRSHGMGVQAGQFVTTGACVVPIPISPGDRVQANFGWLGELQARFSPSEDESSGPQS
jgi:2-keto-4-pentenoate hydratase